MSCDYDEPVTDASLSYILALCSESRNLYSFWSSISLVRSSATASFVPAACQSNPGDILPREPRCVEHLQSNNKTSRQEKDRCAAESHVVPMTMAFSGTLSFRRILHFDYRECGAYQYRLYLAHDRYRSLLQDRVEQQLECNPCQRVPILPMLLEHIT